MGQENVGLDTKWMALKCRLAVPTVAKREPHFKHLILLQTSAVVPEEEEEANSAK